MKLSQKNVIVLGAGLIFISLLVYCYPCKYKIGMSLDQVKNLLSVPPKKIPICGIDYGFSGPTPKELLEDESYQVYDKNEGVFLSFNQCNKIILIKRVKYFGINILTLWNKITKRSEWTENSPPTNTERKPTQKIELDTPTNSARGATDNKR